MVVSTPSKPAAEQPKIVQWGVLYKDAVKGEMWWLTNYYDHALRLHVLKLLPASAEKRAARAKAVIEIDHIRAINEDRLRDRAGMTHEEIIDLADEADFPRVVVAHHLSQIQRRIARWDMGADDPETNRPGLSLIAERLRRYENGNGRYGVSEKELGRILQNEEKLKVGREIVDMVCCEFGLLLDDFISDSFDWAMQRGAWKDRQGGKDAWPCGYVTKRQQDDDLI